MSLEIDFDQTLRPNQIKEKLITLLGKESCSEEIIASLQKTAK